jgi:hypothetical protein
MLQRIRTIILIAICCAFLAPGLLYLGGMGGAGLAGEQHLQKPMALTIDHFLDQRAQGYAEEAFKRRAGLLTSLVKADNQLNYFLFNSVSSNPHSTVILGEQGHLIEYLYLRDLNRLRTPKPEQLEAVVKKLKALQDYLHTRGIKFVLVISPNKPSFYPDIVPARYRIADAEQRFDTRTFMTAALQREGVPFIDGFELLKRKESELQVPMFSPIGTHWNEVGGCLVASEILKQAGASEGRAGFECVVTGNHDRPAYHDSDLLRLANLWYEAPFHRPAPRVQAKRIQQEDARPWRLLTIGSSFCWELMRQFDNSGALSNQEFLYYFHRRTKHPSSRGKNFDHSRYNVWNELKARDLVVIEINEAVLERAGFGFPERVLESLARSESK